MLVNLARLERWFIDRKKAQSSKPVHDVVENIKQFMNNESDGKRALISFSTYGLAAALKAEKATYFNPGGACLEMVKVLNELGYVVDVCDWNDLKVEIHHDYDIFLGHGAANFKIIADKLKPETKKMLYLTGCHFESAIEMTDLAYTRVAKEKDVKRSVFKKPVRVWMDEQAAMDASDAIICLGNETAKSFKTKIDKPIYPINNGAYVKDCKITTNGEKGFLYYGGAGNIQKGLDILISAFSNVPQAHFYIYGKLEKEVLDHYSEELGRSNIHYIYPIRKFSWANSYIRRKCKFVTLCGFATGQSTALIASTNEGLIPVVNVEADLPQYDYTICIKETTVSGAIIAIRESLDKSDGWLNEAQIGNQKMFARYFQPIMYKNSLKKVIKKVCNL